MTIIGSLTSLAMLVTAYDLWIVAQHPSAALHISVGNKLLIVGRAVWIYLFKMLNPTMVSPLDTFDLTDLHPERADQYFYPLSALAVIAFLWLFRKHVGKAPVCSGSYFLVTLAPVLGFVSFSFMKHALVADRFLYLASLGLVIPAGAAIERSIHYRHFLLSFVAWLFLTALAASSFYYSFKFQSSRQLFEYAIVLNPTALVAHAGLGNIAVQESRWNDAALHYSNALQVQPEYTDARVSLAWVLMTQGHRLEAIRQLRIVLRLKPGLPEAQKLLKQLQEQG